MKRSRSSFLKWLLIGPSMVVVSCVLVWASVTMMIRGEGLTIYLIGTLLGILGLILTCIGWFDKLSLHKYVLSWMEK